MPKNGKSYCDQPLALALACGSTMEAAAQKAGLSVSTAYRRSRQPQFMQQVRHIRQEMLSRACAALTAASLQSVQTLLALLDAKVPHATRLGAARSILEIGCRLRLENDLVERLEQLEAEMQRR